MNLRALRWDTRGASLVEVLVSLLVFTVAVLGLTSSGVVSSGQVREGWTDSRLWSAVHHQLDSLTAAGYASVTSGADTVAGYEMVWTVEAGNPKKIVLVTGTANYKGVAAKDTFVTYLAKSP